MSNSRIEQNKFETYAQVLLEAAVAEGREAADLEILKAVALMPQELIDLLTVMSENGDLGHLGDVTEIYGELVAQHTDVITAEVTVAVPLTDELKAEIISKLEHDFGKDVYLIEKVDPSIMGGLILKVGDERRDISVRSQLEHVRATLSDVITSGGDN